eukprot:CAMPEP_0167751988 /NCGR_PEP_ID=MMETSP0110_2-20121227/6883_1 /TAXON_ID=629695 /ORGANISM="Gymnochlora sp., Strain CCMP2014" /LENGTH=371 /DNA_ID=CAMNT_0007637543 /DNA_START=198 /DNA_END=1314 /DNA_ORIENTATION=+
MEDGGAGTRHRGRFRVCFSLDFEAYDQFVGPDKERKKDRDVSPQVRKRLAANGWSTEMGDYEAVMLQHITFPNEIKENMSDIGGCEAIKEAIEEVFILPMTNPGLFKGKLMQPPKGMLFYGVPGTGKTMMARAICKCTGSTFFNIRMSAIQSKWFGDSVKLIEGLFSIARKMAPSVIFIDEMDAFLHERGLGRDQDGTLAMKAEFMSLWDGLIADTSAGVIVLGATNRPLDIDKAILRRLGRKFEFKLPDGKARNQILTKILKDCKLDTQSISSGKPVSIPILAQMTNGYSGSDLLEMCRTAAMIPVRELVKKQVKSERKSGKGYQKQGVRPLSLGDFTEAMTKVRPTGRTARLYAQRQAAKQLAELSERV